MVDDHRVAERQHVNRDRRRHHGCDDVGSSFLDGLVGRYVARDHNGCFERVIWFVVGMTIGPDIAVFVGAFLDAAVGGEGHGETITVDLRTCKRRNMPAEEVNLFFEQLIFSRGSCGAVASRLHKALPYSFNA
jgi:hypothetical protein